jgi:hypothetical protein
MQPQRKLERNSLIENSMAGGRGCIFKYQTVSVASLVPKGDAEAFSGIVEIKGNRKGISMFDSKDDVA